MVEAAEKRDLERKTPSANGHDSKGRWLAGNAGGPGNPQAKNLAAWRATFAAAVTPNDMRDVALELVKEAKAGKPWAVKELLDRTLGRGALPPDSGDQDTDARQPFVGWVAMFKELPVPVHMPYPPGLPQPKRILAKLTAGGNGDGD